MQIDFYILGDDSHRDINQMVCRLCEKAFQQDMNVLVYTKSTDQAQQLDDLLWTFKADSFIAHQSSLTEFNNDPQFTYPVLIFSAPDSDGTLPSVITHYTQLLINLTTETPPFIHQFQRVAELVSKNTEEKEQARNRYRFYRQNDYTLNMFDL